MRMLVVQHQLVYVADPFSPWGRRWIACSARRMRGRQTFNERCDPSSGRSGHLLPQGEKGRARCFAESERPAGSGKNRVSNASGVLQNLVIPETQDRVALRRQPCVPNGVLPALGVLRAVAFDDQQPFEAGEVDDVRSDRHLPTPFQASQPSTAYEQPELSLHLGPVRTEPTRALDRDTSIEHVFGRVGKQDWPILGLQTLAGQDVRRLLPSSLGKQDGSRCRRETDEASCGVRATPHPALRATFSRKGRREGAPW